MASANMPMTSGGPILSRRRVLVTGGYGQLGRWLARQAIGDLVEVVAIGRADMDFSDAASIERVLDEIRPDVVINAAAYTAVDAAEEDEAAAVMINAAGAPLLASRCAQRDISFLHVSTDYVPGIYSPVDAPATRNALAASAPEKITLGDEVGVYARTKWHGEKEVRRAHPRAVIVRTAWVYTGPARTELGLGGNDFVTTMLRLESEHETINVVDDQWGSPTFACDLADALLRLAVRLAGGDTALEGIVLNATGEGRATWRDLAAETIALAGADPARVHAVTTAEFPRPAARPTFSVLSGEEWRRAGLSPLPHWKAGLRRAFLVGR